MGDRNLVIVGMVFAEGKKTGTVPAVFDESGLQRGFDAGDPRQIDIPLEDLFGGGLVVKFFETGSLDDNHPGFFQEIGRAQSELQSLMRISYAVFCLKKKNNIP